ncbi:MAG: MoaD/ThiS family protein [Bowdeniella nasicola]|nr:MoaD/ThiS family protein [Bowdeniella nasicola]
MTTIRYFAGAAAAAGTDEELCDVRPAACLADVLAELGKDNPHLQQVLEVSTILVDGTPVHNPAASVGTAQVIEVLPPFAGG